MGVEFPRRLSYAFMSSETAFKGYVTGVCRERGYSDDEAWGVRYNYGSAMEGTLSFHVQRIFERYAPQLNSYGRTKTLATVAANNICPQKPSGGGSKMGNIKPRLTLLLMFLGLRNFTRSRLAAPQVMQIAPLQQYNPLNFCGLIVSTNMMPAMTLRPPVRYFL